MLERMLERKTPLPFTRIIITAVMAAILSSITVLISWIPVNTPISTVVAAKFTFRDLKLLMLIFVHNYKPPLKKKVQYLLGISNVRWIILFN